jgi:plastocyanin domain-containing protein
MTAKIIVTALGLALIVFVNWYFLFSRRKPRRD